MDKQIQNLKDTNARLQAEVEQLTDDRSFWMQSSCTWQQLAWDHYKTIQELKVARAASRTDSDRVAFIEGGRYDIQYCVSHQAWYIYDNELKDSVLDSADFGSWREAVDALMDLSEQTV